MLRGEIRVVDFDPSRGNEASKKRPAVIVSNDRANSVAARTGRGVVTVVPLTSSVANVLSFQVFLPASETGLSKDSKAQAEQIRAITAEMIGPRIGTIPHRHMTELEQAIRVHLDL